MSAPLRFESASSEVLRILLLEDSADDAELIRHALRPLGRILVIDQVEEMEAFRDALDRGGYRLVLSDVSLPGFDGLSALLMVRERDPDLPFIVVTGSVPEERAVEFIRQHATDYVSKERLAALPMVVERALREMDHARRAREAEQRARIVVESAPDAILTIDRKGRIQGANLAAQCLLGATEETLRGALASTYMPLAWARQFDGSARYLDDATAAGESPRPREIELHLENGRRIPVELLVSEFTQRRHLFRACFLRDLSERRRMEEQLRQAQKMEAIGSLAAGIAHDFNNVLAVVSGYAELLLDALPRDSENHRHVEQIRFAGDHAAALTRQLLAFSRKQVVKPERMALSQLVGGLAPLLQRSLGERVRLEVRSAPNGTTVVADQAQVQQVLFNLAINARDAMPDGGLLIIEVNPIDFGPEDVSRRSGLSPGPYVEIAVTDTGVGMALDVQKRVFEPFFTTKGAGRGTGIGLATVLGIVEQSRGHVWFYSEPGKGTTFKVYLPRVADAVDGGATAGGGSAREARGQGETLVLVEDEKQVREVVSRILTAAGYRLRTFASARDALAGLQDPGAEPPRLLLTDLVMPEMGGDELAREARKALPQLPVLFMSGYAQDLVAGKIDDLAPFHHIGKPFGAKALREKVRRLLDEDETSGH